MTADELDTAADRLVLRAGFEAAMRLAACDCLLDGEVCLADLARAEIAARYAVLGVKPHLGDDNPYRGTS